MDALNIIYAIMRESLIFAIPLLLVALGGMFAEKSGVVNIALEGIMVFGAFCSIWFINIMQGKYPDINPSVLLLMAGVIAIIAGMLFSTLLAVSAINFKADQTIGGTAINLLAPALVVYIARAVQNVKNIQFTANFAIQKVPLLGDIPALGDILFQKVNIMVYVGFMILMLAWVVIYKTKFGLRLSACGEHPSAADSVGINVYRMRWAGVIISGALGGLGGLVFIVSSSVSFGGDVAGYGFLAIAVMIFGQWKPEKILLASLFFGLTKAFAYKYTLIPGLSTLNIGNFFKMLPYIATMVVLVFTSKKSRAPKAEGIPYDQGAR